MAMISQLGIELMNAQPPQQEENGRQMSDTQLKLQSIIDLFTKPHSDSKGEGGAQEQKEKV